MPQKHIKHGPAKFPTPKAVSRPIKVPRRAQFPEPPAIFRGVAAEPKFVGGPQAFVDAHPELFGGATVSAPEGYVYWALLQILGKPEVAGWTYQGKLAGGRHLPGGQMPDFEVWTTNPPLIIRVQGERIHLQAGPRRIALDEEDALAAQNMGFRLIDVFPTQYVSDQTGQAVILIVRDALKGIQRPNPASFGVVRFGAGELRPV